MTEIFIFIMCFILFFKFNSHELFLLMKNWIEEMERKYPWLKEEK